MTIRDNLFFEKPHIYKSGAGYIFCLHHLRCAGPTPFEARANWVALFSSSTCVTLTGTCRVLREAEKHGKVRIT